MYLAKVLPISTHFSSENIATAHWTVACET